MSFSIAGGDTRSWSASIAASRSSNFARHGGRWHACCCLWSSASFRGQPASIYGVFGALQLAGLDTPLPFKQESKHRQEKAQDEDSREDGGHEPCWLTTSVRGSFATGLPPSMISPFEPERVCCTRSDEDDAFGWHLFHDRQRNLVYYLHSYTGEVRWPRPETVGFVMHGLKPLPAQAEAEAASVVNPDIWSPYYPHVVMLPSGLVQVHPGPGADARGATEMWCGYNRFPLRNVGGNADDGVLTQQGTARPDRAANTSPGPRVLPPTWEESRSGSPFLPPYPVTVLGRDDKETKHPAERPRPPLRRLDEQFQTPEIEPSRSYRQLGRVQGSMDWSSFSRELPSNATSVPTIERKQPGGRTATLRCSSILTLLAICFVRCSVFASAASSEHGEEGAQPQRIPAAAGAQNDAREQLQLQLNHCSAKATQATCRSFDEPRVLEPRT
jgi:hypothetical protein